MGNSRRMVFRRVGSRREITLRGGVWARSTGRWFREDTEVIDFFAPPRATLEFRSSQRRSR